MSSGPDGRTSLPKLVFAAGSLEKGGGGIAELSRQVFATLLEMRREKLLDLELHVLDERGPAAGDPLFAHDDLPPIHWSAGKRWKFVSGLLFSRPDVFLFDHVGLARLQGLLPKSLALPYLLLIHSVEIWNNDRPDYHRTARKARLLIANSEYTARKARNHYPDLPEITVCWPGKDTEAVVGPVNEAGFGELGPHAMLIVGRLDARQKHKGHDQLIEAMPLVLKRVPDARLVIVGDGTDRERLENKVKAMGLDASVLFTGRVGELQLQTLYNRCALFVMPSDGDGFGLVFLEAMGHGLPCVGLQQGAAVEIFDEGKFGFLVDRDDTAEMAGNLASLLLDEKGRRSLGEAGFARYRSMFTGQKHSGRLSSIIRQQLGG